MLAGRRGIGIASRRRAGVAGGRCAVVPTRLHIAVPSHQGLAVTGGQWFGGNRCVGVLAGYRDGIRFVDRHTQPLEIAQERRLELFPIHRRGLGDDVRCRRPAFEQIGSTRRAVAQRIHRRMGLRRLARCQFEFRAPCAVGAGLFEDDADGFLDVRGDFPDPVLDRVVLDADPIGAELLAVRVHRPLDHQVAGGAAADIADLFMNFHAAEAVSAECRGVRAGSVFELQAACDLHIVVGDEIDEGLR
ncbi:hypothetical protein [Nocardia cyriacigeorgica]|uniref:hypothetical protein n=1 Tax=Nocardia cyriacigeorgica TaxID=135487 RepID=UPI001485FC2E|nr:hypothetical protein [Nocardia cyriacigeorgica]